MHILQFQTFQFTVFFDEINLHLLKNLIMHIVCSSHKFIDKNMYEAFKIMYAML